MLFNILFMSILQNTIIKRIKKELIEVNLIKEKIVDYYIENRDIEKYKQDLSSVLFATGDITTYLIQNELNISIKKYKELMSSLDIVKENIRKEEEKINIKEFKKVAKFLNMNFKKIIHYNIRTDICSYKITTIKRAKFVVYDIYYAYGIDYLKKIFLHKNIFSLRLKTNVNLYDFLIE